MTRTERSCWLVNGIVAAGLMTALAVVASCERQPGPNIQDPPPARYRANGQYTIVTTSLAVIQRMCPDTPNARACTVNHTVFMLNPCNESDYRADAECHEFGHVQGWPSDHPRS